MSEVLDQIRDCCRDRREVEAELTALRRELDAHPEKPSARQSSVGQKKWLAIKTEYDSKRAVLLEELRQLEDERHRLRETMKGEVHFATLGPLIDKLVDIEDRIAEVDPDIHQSLTHVIDWLEEVEAQHD